MNGSIRLPRLSERPSGSPSACGRDAAARPDLPAPGGKLSLARQIEVQTTQLATVLHEAHDALGNLGIGHGTAASHTAASHTAASHIRGAGFASAAAGREQFVLTPVQTPAELRHVLTIGEDSEVVDAWTAARRDFRLELGAVSSHEVARVVAGITGGLGGRAARNTAASNTCARDAKYRPRPGRALLWARARAGDAPCGG
jgi:hypothetical protein